MTRYTFTRYFKSSVYFYLVYQGCFTSALYGKSSGSHWDKSVASREIHSVSQHSSSLNNKHLLALDSPERRSTVAHQSLVVQPRSSVIPTVLSSYPANGATQVDVNVANIGADELSLPPGGVDNKTLTNHTVRLFQINSDDEEVAIAGTVNGSAGGDAIRFTPSFALNFSTKYRFEITAGLKAADGTAFTPYHATFTTKSATGSTSPLSEVEFVKVPIPGTYNERYTSLTMGPDGKLYGLQINGLIKRFPIRADGTLGTPESINTLKNAYKSATNPNGDRSAIGLTFDPTSTAGNLIAWVTHCSSGLYTAPEFDGNLSKLSGPALGTHQLVLTRLPRSRKDHLVNSIAFGPDGALYFNQGSNTAAGVSDSYWQRDETLLSGAVLRLDLKKLSGLRLPLNVETSQHVDVINRAPSNRITMSDGKYNPYATNSPLTIYASGIRNAYDLVWHSNGQLYVPANGTGPGGNSPASVPGTRRPGLHPTFYKGAAIPPTDSVPTQNDWLFRIDPRLPIPGYFGHPNPLRGQYVINRGPVDNPGYPANIVPDADYRGAAYNFLPNKSPNGAIEYKSNTFGGALKGKLLVCRFSGGGDIIILEPNSSTFDIKPETVLSGSGNGIPSLSGFTNPLDVVEDVKTGNLYIAEYDWNTAGTKSQITLLRVAKPDAPAGMMALSPDKIVDNAVSGGPGSAKHAVTIGNTGTAPLVITSIAVVGTHANQYRLSALPTLPFQVPSGGAVRFNVTFNPMSIGSKVAKIRVGTLSNATKEVSLSGLATPGLGGTNEPPLQAILDAYGIPVNVGDDDKTTNVIHSNPSSQQASPLGDEISVQAFQKSGEKDVIVEPLAVFGPTTVNPVVRFGWYNSSNATSQHELFTVSTTPESNAQSVNPACDGLLSFNPLGTSFGFYSCWPSSSDRHVYSEDRLNTFAGAIPHHVRVYLLKDVNGVVPNAYIVATEAQTFGLDYQDAVIIVRNVKPAPSQVFTALRINAGSTTQAVFDGNTFIADSYYTGAGLIYHNNRIADIANTTSDALYKTERTATKNLESFGYSIPVLSGTHTYTVKLHFAEIFYGATGGLAGGAGQRVFNVTGEGNPLLTNYDIYQEVGAMKAIVKTFNVSVSDGFLTLNFTSSTERPKISAIEILPSGANHAPVVDKPIPAQMATVATHYNFSFGANTFSDPENNSLNYSASLSDNSALPAWLSFNAATRTFSGTAPSGSVSPLNIKVTASDGQLSASTSFSLTIQPASTATALYLINVGGAAVSTGGRNWSADQYFDRGTPLAKTTVGDVANTTDDVLYYSERYRGETGFNYNIPVPSAGMYTVKLHFAETNFVGDKAGVGKRVFNVSLEGQPVLTNFDITAEAGTAPAALVKPFSAQVSDGKLTLSFSSVVGDADVMAIEVYAGNGQANPTTSQAARTITGEPPMISPTLLAYPNPISQGRFKVLLSEAFQGEVSYVLTYQSGVVLTSGKITLHEPASVLSFDFSREIHASGVYFLHLEGQHLKGFLKLVQSQ